MKARRKCKENAAVTPSCAFQMLWPEACDDSFSANGAFLGVSQGIRWGTNDIV